MKDRKQMDEKEAKLRTWDALCCGKPAQHPQRLKNGSCRVFLTMVSSVGWKPEDWLKVCIRATGPSVFPHSLVASPTPAEDVGLPQAVLSRSGSGPAWRGRRL